jgi:Glycosyltransferase family 87
LALLPFCLPVLGNLQMGQITMVVCFLITAMWALERSGRSSTASLMLGAAAAIKLFPIYLAVYYVVQGRVRPLVAALISFLTLTFITALVLGPDSYHDYVGIVLPWNSEFRIIGFNLSIAGFWHKLFHPCNEGEKIIPLWHSLVVARWGTLFSNLAISVIVAISTRQARTRSQQDLAFATIVTAMLLVSPVTWDTSLLLLLVPIAIIACNTRNHQSGWAPIALMLILPTVWLPQPLLTILATAGRTIEVAPPSFLLGVASLKFYALLGTLALALLALRADYAQAWDRTVDGTTTL